MFDRADLTPRERLLAVFQTSTRHCAPSSRPPWKCPTQPPARVLARDYKLGFAARLTEAAREAGASDPNDSASSWQLLLDGASARTRVLDTDTFTTAAASTSVIVDNADPHASRYRWTTRGNFSAGN